MFLIKEFISKLGIDKFFDKAFKTNDPVFESVLEKDALASQHTVDRKAGRAFNFHYQSNGYHPFVCYDGMTGDLIKIQFRDGTQYSCTRVVDFRQSILDEYLNDYPAVRILFRGDSGFAAPGLYKQCEENGTSYVIRLKENGLLREKPPILWMSLKRSPGIIKWIMR